MNEFEKYREKIAGALRQTAFPNNPEFSITLWYRAAESVIAALTINDLETMASYKRTIEKARKAVEADAKDL